MSITHWAGRSYFNPCSPCGERPTVQGFLMEQIRFQSMLPVRGATFLPDLCLGNNQISIHAPRAGSDPCPSKSCPVSSNFNPCSPCGERLCSAFKHCSAYVFQSMLPVRGATFQAFHFFREVIISIHAPRAGSDSGCPHGRRRPPDFNPCSPCGERLRPSRVYLFLFNFNPCSPCGERPAQHLRRGGLPGISIHAPRAGSDPR